MSFAFCFIGLNILAFMFSYDSTSSSLCFHKTQRPLLYVFRVQCPLSLWFHRTQYPMSLCFIELKVLYFLFHETHFPAFELKVLYFVGRPDFFSQDFSFSYCDLSNNHSNRISALSLLIFYFQ